MGMENRKNGFFHGQVAMEYLVTYGWAFVALFAVVAILFSTGMLSPSGFAQQECTFQPDLPCKAFILATDAVSTSSLNFQLVNGLGYKIQVTELTFTSYDLGSYGRQVTVIPITGPLPAYIDSGYSRTFSRSFSGPAQPELNSMRTVLVTITYMNCKSLPCTGPYNTTGRIVAAAQAISSTSCGSSSDCLISQKCSGGMCIPASCNPLCSLGKKCQHGVCV
jgi:hypothetical protein